MMNDDHILNTPQPDTVVWVTASGTPTREQKLVCVELVTRLADDGWVITGTPGDPITPLVRQATRAMGGSYTETSVSADTGDESPELAVLVPRALRDAVTAGACTLGARAVGECAVLHVHLLPHPSYRALAGPVAGVSAVVRRGGGVTR